jgi:hypothetical protein
LCGLLLWQMKEMVSVLRYCGTSPPIHHRLFPPEGILLRQNMMREDQLRLDDDLIDTPVKPQQPPDRWFDRDG